MVRRAYARINLIIFCIPTTFRHARNLITTFEFENVVITFDTFCYLILVAFGSTVVPATFNCAFKNGFVKFAFKPVLVPIAFFAFADIPVLPWCNNNYCFSAFLSGRGPVGGFNGRTGNNSTAACSCVVYFPPPGRGHGRMGRLWRS